MIDYSRLYDALRGTPLEQWLDTLPAQIQERLHPGQNRLIPEWQGMLESLPEWPVSSVDLCSAAIRVGERADIDEAQRHQLKQSLKKLHPWRKGPFDFFGLVIDTEWRSDLKWDRLCEEIEPLEGRVVLDIGCGNGYHGWRMRGAKAKLVLGIDPIPLYVTQYGVMAHFLNTEPVFVLPLKVEDLPASLTGFDTVFSMGVLYHRRSPIDHLMKMKELLRSGGEMVLETLVVEGEKGYALLPGGRYAKMRNVWFIPAPSTLMHWVQRCGFKDARLIDVTQTTPEEQRPTNWMQFESLPDFLDPADPNRTIEGYPAPRRAIVLARK